jgi:hypothetical protein
MPVSGSVVLQPEMRGRQFCRVPADGKAAPNGVLGTRAEAVLLRWIGN